MNYHYKTIIVNSKFLNKSLAIIIALPNNFDTNKNYSTYLVFDGNDLLNPDKENILFTNDKIIIGISCDNNVERFNNWSTYHNQQVVAPMKKRYPELVSNQQYLGGNGDNFIKFITKELLSLLKSDHQINIKDLNLLGCSMGAYFSLQMLYLSNLTFKKVLLFSPSIWFNPNIINDLTIKELNNNQKLIIKLWVGLKEPKTFEKTFNVDYYQDTLKIQTILEKKANVNVDLTIDNNGAHGFKWWIEFINNHLEWW